ncbi:MAG: DUF3995 domain-containing protein [Hyphomicrobiales bacterium]|nr:MAG: DUF3995 domain-containing protein [Hyphomicrobiales bacterium]
MTLIVAIAVALLLAAISLVHLIWAFGSTWPAGNEKALARMVTGFPGATRMPPRTASAAVAAVLFAAALWALAMTGISASALLTLGGAALAGVFLLRGLIAYTPWWRARTPEQPFASLDRKYYAPLCLALAAGFAVLTAARIV